MSASLLTNTDRLDTRATPDTQGARAVNLVLGVGICEITTSDTLV